ncbi:MAG: hypothetical protein AAF702_29075 [Chloroflexota bacterium]
MRKRHLILKVSRLSKEATKSVDPELLGEDSILEPNESFTMIFDIGLAKRRKFRFKVDAYGVADDLVDSAALDQDGFIMDVDESQIEEQPNYLFYLPTAFD